MWFLRCDSRQGQRGFKFRGDLNSRRLVSRSTSAHRSSGRMAYGTNVCGTESRNSHGNKDDGAFDWQAWEVGSGIVDNRECEHARRQGNLNERMGHGRHDPSRAAGKTFHISGARDVLRPNGRRAIRHLSGICGEGRAT